MRITLPDAVTQSSHAADIATSRWKPTILYYLQQGTWRFGELRRQIPQITQQMLTTQLRELERDGIIQRTVYAEVPPRVEYAMTAYGRTLEPFLAMMAEWGARHAARQSEEQAVSE